MHAVTQESSRLMDQRGSAATLQAVHIQGQITGLLLTMTAHQHYQNTGPDNLEVIYTFPLPWGATLLELSAEIGGHKLQGMVFEKSWASDRYEQALDDGDTPIMVEQTRDGLYTANLGCLQAGETAIISIEYAQLLRFEQGHVRITVPTTVAPRFGDAHTQGGLAVHESVDTDLMVAYPLTVEIRVTGEMAWATMESPTHALTLTRQDEVVLVRLTDCGLLDQDFVLLLQGVQAQSFATVAPDGDDDGFAVLASFCPHRVDHRPEPLLLKILVDCSGSMAGDSMESAREALHEVLKELDAQDWVSYSRFGDQVIHDMPGLMPCDPAARKMVVDLIHQTEADLGGTELNDALLSTFNEGTGPLWRRCEGLEVTPAPRQDVLLITDGDIWDSQSVMQSARDSGHRVFAVGVGCAPAQSLLREAAEKSGGACELVSPQQSPVEAIVRMFRRLRSPSYSGIGVDWGQPVLWQSAIPPGMYAGDTLHLCARVASPPEAAPVLSWMLEGNQGRATAGILQRRASALLPRLVAARQIERLQQAGADDAQILELALRYQLVTEVTSLLLVHVRADGQKARSLPVVKNVTHMRAAGWGGVGSVKQQQALSAVCCTSIGSDFGFDDMPSLIAPWSQRRGSATPSAAKVLIEEPPLPWLTEADLHRPDDTTVWDPMAVLKAFERDVVAGRLQDGAFVTKYLAKFPLAVLNTVNGMKGQISSRKQAMALLIDWIAQALKAQFTLSGQSRRILRHSLGQLEANVVSGLRQRLTQACGALLPGGVTA